MSTKIIFPDKSEIVIDNTLKRGKNLDASVTEHPVEDGTKISDHVMKSNITYSLDGKIATTFIKDDNITRHIEISDKFYYAWNKSITLIVVTPNERLENLQITSYSESEDKKNSKSSGTLSFSVSFKQITTVKGKTAKVPKNAIGKPKPTDKDKNTKTNKSAKDTRDRQQEQNKKGKQETAKTNATQKKKVAKVKEKSMLLNLIGG